MTLTFVPQNQKGSSIGHGQHMCEIPVLFDNTSEIPLLYIKMVLIKL